ncbi:hypothetical protein DFH09DRAFT_1074902 [Mycena vulgaris]|nr:hypothetical protein DFH09DRAFT_1074902 [Mycena vulgaris]
MDFIQNDSPAALSLFSSLKLKRSVYHTPRRSLQTPYSIKESLGKWTLVDFEFKTSVVTTHLFHGCCLYKGSQKAQLAIARWDAQSGRIFISEPKSPRKDAVGREAEFHREQGSYVYRRCLAIYKAGLPLEFGLLPTFELGRTEGSELTFIDSDAFERNMGFTYEIPEWRRIGRKGVETRMPSRVGNKKLMFTRFGARSDMS